MIISILGDLVIGVTGLPVGPRMVALSIALSIAMVLLILLPMLLISVGCIIYWGKAKNAAGVVLLIGNMLILSWHFFNLGSIISGPYASGGDTEKYSFGFLISGLIFSVGFLLMAIAAPRKVAPPSQM